MQRLAGLGGLTAFFLLSVLLVLFTGPARAEGQSADEVMEKANRASYYAGKDGKARVTMTIKSASGATRTRELTMLRYDIEDGGRQKYYVYFHKPLDVEGMIFMVWKNVGADDDRWLYVPAIDLVKRVAASNKRASFAGSHFTYEDVSGRSPALDTHELIGSEKVGGADAYVVKNTPRDADLVEFSYYTVWVDKKSFLPIKAEYFDKGGRLLRVMTTEEVKDIQGVPTVVKARADEPGSGSTLVEFNEIRYDVGLSEGVFDERYLRRPPRQWVK